MSGCPFHKLRDDLPPLTPRIAALPVDERGYPVPFFVQWFNGKPDFRIGDGKKWRQCVRESLCWVCGQKLETAKTFVIGPMCSITRSTAEPPCHPECAEWSAKGCPFLARPQMTRREIDEARIEIETGEKLKDGSGGVMIDRNPGVTCLWETTKFTIFMTETGPLIEVGDPVNVVWYREGRPALKSEVQESIHTGLPALRDMCDNLSSHLALDRSIQIAEKFLPTI